MRPPTLWLLLLPVLALPATAADRGKPTMKPLAQCSDFDPAKLKAEGWVAWSPREEIAPKCTVDPKGGRNGGSALRMQGAGVPGVYGLWKRRVTGVVPGRSYQGDAYYRTEGVTAPHHSVSLLLSWLDAEGKPLRAPDCASVAGTEDGWTRLEQTSIAPAGAKSAEIQLYFSWAPNGSVWWDDVELAEVTSPRDRVVRVATIKHRPRDTGSAAASVEQFCKIAESSGVKSDILCLPEGVTVVGTGKSYAEVAEPLHGPTVKRLGELARKMTSYVVAGLYERVGTLVYNTAVLVDRKGELVGSYRKTHLPREEVESGITPGDEYPVFQTDFGKVGLMICWDVQFPEPARAMGVKGADLILLPIWGGNDVLARARAIENHVFLVTSSYDMPTYVVDPEGKVLAEATEQKPVAVAELHLDREILQPWLGNMKGRTWKERRGDLRVE